MEGLYEDRKEEEEFTKAYIDNMYKFYGYGMWIVELKNGTVIGRAGISNREIDVETCFEVGYVIGKPYQKNGYATEALKAIIEYAHKELEIEKLYCVVRPENEDSIKLALRCGFEYVAESFVDDIKYNIYIR